MKNSWLEKIITKLKIVYWNQAYESSGKMVYANIFSPEIYKEIWRELNILVRYIEDMDAIFLAGEIPEKLQSVVVDNLNKIINETKEDVKFDIRIPEGFIKSKMVEFKGWYTSLNDKLYHIT